MKPMKAFGTLPTEPKYGVGFEVEVFRNNRHLGDLCERVENWAKHGIKPGDKVKVTIRKVAK